MKQKTNPYIIIHITLSVLILSVFITIYYFNDLVILRVNEAFRALVNVFGASLAFCFALYQYVIIQQKNKSDFLKLGIENKNNTTIITLIENSSVKDKKIEFACLIITPHHGNENQLINDINDLKGESRPLIKYTNDINNWKDSGMTVSLDYQKQFIPIPFYYSENIRIGNESLQYEVPLMIENLNKGNYSVRFFVFSTDSHYHRSTHCILTKN